MTTNDVTEPARLYDPPYTDRNSAGIDHYFGESDVDAIVEILDDVTRHTSPIGAA